MPIPENSVIMISGAARGIGLATARLLAERGCKLSLGVRDTAAIDPEAFAEDALVARWDATEPETSQAWATQTLERFGKIDGIVLNAGVALSAGLDAADEAAFDTMWEVNFKGPLRLMQAVMPSLRTSDHGRVVNIVSLSGKRLLSGSNLGYAASKYAAMALTHAIRRDGWDDGVRATAICPGLVDTRMVADVEAPEGQFKIDPETIAETVAYALGLPDNAVVAEILVNSRLEAMF